MTWNQHLLEIGSVGNVLSLPLFTVDDKLIDALKRQDVAGLYASSAGLLGLNLLNLDNPGVIDATVLQSKDKTLIPMPILGKATSESFNDSEQKITVTNSSPYAAQARCRAVDGGIWVTSPVAANSSASLLVNVPEGVATECQLTGTAAGGTDITALQTPVVAVTAAETNGTGTDLPIATWKNLLQKLVTEANEVINSEDYNKYSLESRTVLNTTTEYASALLQERLAESAEYTAAYIRLDNALKTLKLVPTEPKPTGQPGVTTAEPKPAEQPGGTTSEPKPTGQPGVTTAEPKPAEQPGGTTSEPKPTEQPGGEVDALRKELRELIERYTETNSKDTYVYADETVKAELDALIKQAKELAEKDNVTPEELKALISKINTAFASLNGNRNQLVKEIERIEKITSSTQFINADSELKEQLVKLLEEAKTAVKDGSITEEQLLKLLAQLNSVLASINATSNTDSPTSENPTSATPTTQSPEPTQTEPAATPEKSNPLKWLLLIPVLLALGLGGSYAVYLNQVAGGDRAPLQPGQANFADFVRWLQNLPPRP